MYADHRVTRKRLGDSVERHAIGGIVECRYKNGAIGDVEIRVARRQPLAIHRYGPGKGNRNYAQRTLLGCELQTAEGVPRSHVVLVGRVLLVRQNHRVARAEPRDVGYMPASVVAGRLLTRPS